MKKIIRNILTRLLNEGISLQEIEKSIKTQYYICITIIILFNIDNICKWIILDVNTFIQLLIGDVLLIIWLLIIFVIYEEYRKL